MIEQATTATIVNLAAVRCAAGKSTTAPENLPENTIQSPIQPEYSQDTACEVISIQPDTSTLQPSPSLDAAFKTINQRLYAASERMGNTSKFGAEEAAKILAGAMKLSSHINPGETVKVWAVIKGCETPELTNRFLYHKSKPLLEEAGIWIKKHPRGFEWVNWKKHEKCRNDVGMSECNVGIAPQQRRNVGIIDRVTLYRASRDPYSTIVTDLDGNPVIQRHRKPFTGELTEAEKAALRESAEQAAFAKLIGTKGKVSTRAAALFEQKQLEAIERKAAMDAQMDTLFLWSKVAALLGIAAFVISTIGTGATTNQQTELPQGIYGHTD